MLISHCTGDVFWISLSNQTMNLKINNGKHLALNTTLCLQKTMCNWLKECNLRLEFVLFSEKKEKKTKQI